MINVYEYNGNDGWCENCDVEGRRPLVTIAFGLALSGKRIVLCTQCVEALSDATTFVLAKHGKAVRS